MAHSSSDTVLRNFSVTNRMVLAIAVPMTLAYLTTPLIGVVGTAVVGQFGDAALIGGLAAGAIVFDVVFATFNFLRSGTTGLVAQSFGRGDRIEEQAVFWRALAVAAFSGVLLLLLAPAFVLAGTAFLGAEADVNSALETYVLIRFIGAPFALANYVVLGYVLGRGEAAFGLLLQVVLNGTNIILSLYLGLHLGWRIEGVAWAAVAGELAALVFGMALLAVRFRKAGFPPLGRIAHLGAFGQMMSLNRDIMIRSFVLLGAFALFARQGAQFGTLTLAANAVLMNFFLVAGYFLDGFATAAEQLAGRAIGARDRTAFSAAVRLSAVWGFGLALATTATMLLFGKELVALVTTAPDVRAAAGTYLPWAAFTAVSGVLAFEMDGVFIGATWSRDMRNMMLLSFAVFLAALLTLGAAFGNHGLWGALHLFLLVRGASLLAVLPRRARSTF
ncbi:MATE family efflux transporter [Mesorhizobium sp. L-8-3]|uniref:MATE family efflux transporter n=1 Tax=Mesorhizobium sp. L-8-3 TaxID=2744522 RepID=UPI001935321E|nr:MATE family efflux transporter [Mesorhizobium sp. L-8-3]